MNDRIYFAILDSSIRRVAAHYTRGILQWAATHRPELTKKEKVLIETFNRLVKAGAKPSVVKVIINQWEKTVEEIIEEWEKMIRRW